MIIQPKQGSHRSRHKILLAQVILGRGQSGSSLVGVLVAAGIIGIVALILSQVVTSGFKGQKSIENRSDMEAIKRYLLANVSCSYSVTTCKPGAAMPLYYIGSNSRVSELIPAKGKLFDTILVRGECNGTGDGIIARGIYVAKGSSTSSPKIAPDPLTGNKFDFRDKESLLFPTGVDLCKNLSIDKYPQIVRCTNSSHNNIGVGTTEYRRISFTAPNRVNPMYSSLVVYQGLSSGGVERISYRQNSGQIVGMAWNNPVTYVPTPNGVATWRAGYSNATTYRCPSKLKLDGRLIDSF